MARIENDGVGIAYEILNADSPKTPICFIAGLGGTRQLVMGMAQEFAKDRPVVLHDHRGTGESDKPLGVYSVEDMASDMVAVLDDAGIDRAHFAGFSTGGAICQILALDYSDRVETVALCCTWPKTDHFFRRQFECRKQVLLEQGVAAVTKLSSFALYDPEYFTDHFEQISAQEEMIIANASPPEVLAARMDAIIAHDQLERLDQIDKPTIIVCARNDAVCPDYQSKLMAAKIPNAELKLYDDGGHFFYLPRAGEFHGDLAAFIQRHE